MSVENNSSKSSTLFHFTSKVEYLKEILTSGFTPRAVLEPAPWLYEHTVLLFPMTCFCDIPLGRVNSHTSFYGGYGVGITHDWGRRNGVHPLIYCAVDGIVSQRFSELWELRKCGKEKEISDALLDISMLMKPVNGYMVRDQKVVSRNFDYENEWRYIPKITHGSNSDLQACGYTGEPIRPGISSRALSGLLGDQAMHQQAASPNWTRVSFESEDLRYIIVRSDDDIPDMIDHIEENLLERTERERKIMMSRIISLESIQKDY